MSRRTALVPVSPPRPLPLTPGSRVETTLSPGETHTYRLDLPPGRFADMVVEQEGIDVVVRLLGLDGRPFPEVDSPNGTRGPEPLPVLGAAGPLRLEIAGSSASPGRYSLRVLAARPATDHDRARVEAERGFAAAEGLRRTGSRESLRAAAAGLEEAAARFQALGERGRTADALYALGRVRQGLGELPAALLAYEKALSGFRSQGDRDAMGRALNSAAALHRELGAPRAAHDRAREALAVLGSQGDARIRATAFNNLGRAQEDLGRREEALASYDQALALWRRQALPADQGRTLSNRGALLASLGQIDRALDDLEQALVLLQGSPAAADALGERGYLRFRAGRHREAAADLENVLALRRRQGDRRGEALALNDLGMVRQAQGNLEQARRELEAAVAAFRRLGDPPNEATALVNLGRLLHSTGDAGGAKAAFAKALASFEASGRREGEAAARLGLAQVRRLLGDLPGALREAEPALALIEELRTEPGSHKLRSSFFASYQEAFAFAVDTAMELHGRDPASGWDGRAFELSERARARSLLDALTEAGADPRQGIDPALLAREAAAGERLAAVERHRQALVDSGAPAARLERTERELRRQLGELDRVEAEIRGASRPSTARRLSLEKIRRELDPETLLLSYFLGNRRSFLWAVGSESVQAWTLPPRAELETAARRAHALLADSRRLLGRAQADAALAGLSRLLVAPAAGQLAGRRRLAIVSDGALHLLPFAALPEPGAGALPLIARREIVTVPSASSLAALRRGAASRVSPPAVVAVLADPVFTADDPRVQGGAGAPPSAGSRSAAVPGRSFPRLPRSSEEARALLALAPPGERLAALGFDARRELITAGALARFRVVHFATHGVLDPEHPELSGIALSMVDPQGRPRDGLLRAHEIYRLRLPADLVVLSACETALGREVRGEGVVGLTRAFFHAGARRVLVSLWSVEDNATAELMRRFYEGHFGQGLPPAAALRQAQDEMRRRPERRAPHYWAGFTLQGDWR